MNVDPTSEVDVDSEAPQQELLREGVTMALYVSLSLLAVIVALPNESETTQAATIAVTSLGLILAHWMAFRISSRYAQRGQVTKESVELIGAQISGGLIVTVVAVVPVILFDRPLGSEISLGLLTLFVCATAYVAARSVPVSRTRALIYVGIILALTAGIVTLKTLVGH